MVVSLFVPGDRPERFAKAVASGADLAILDLEDAVAPERKSAARDAVWKALRGGLQACVRINVTTSDAGSADLAMLGDCGPRFVMLPKVSGPRDIDTARQRLPEIPFVALIESIDGMRRIEEIAGVPGVTAIALGGYDLCAELGARPTAEVLAPWRSRLVFAARIAGIQAIDTPYVQIEDEAGLREDARRAVDFGFDGKLAIHPKQVAPVRDAFTPGAAEIERARAIVAAASGGGVVKLDGVMIDAPLVAAAGRVLSRIRT